MDCQFNSPIATKFHAPETVTTGAITTCALTQPHHVIRLPKSSGSVKFQDVEAKVKGSERSATTRFLITFNEKEEDTKFKAAEKAWHLKKWKMLGGVGLLRFFIRWCLDKTSIIEKESRLISSYSSSNDVISSYWILSLQLFYQSLSVPRPIWGHPWRMIVTQKSMGLYQVNTMI